MSTTFPNKLFCKPGSSLSLGMTKRDFGMTKDLLFSKEFPDIHGTISFRSLDLKNDLPIIHSWVQQDYAHEYWQMTGPFSQFYANYQCMELNPYSHSFVGVLDYDLTPPPAPKGEEVPRSARDDKESIICQFDVYSVFADELKEHINPETHDCGFHLLMSPNRNPVPGLTGCVIKAFLEYYFSFAEAKRMYAEPDINNEKSIVLLERAGFDRVKTVEMSYKRAYVYCLERQGPSSLRSSG